MDFVVNDHTKDILTITVFDKDLFSPNGKLSRMQDTLGAWFGCGACMCLSVHKYDFTFFSVPWFYQDCTL